MVFLSWLSPPARIRAVLFLYCKDASTMGAEIITSPDIVRAITPWIIFRSVMYIQFPSTTWTSFLRFHFYFILVVNINNYMSLGCFLRGSASTDRYS